MNIDSGDNPSWREIMRLAYYDTGVAKGLAADARVAVRTGKHWYGSDHVPSDRILPTASGIDRRLARLEARLRLARHRLKREIESAEAREVAAARHRARLRPAAALSRAPILRTPV